MFLKRIEMQGFKSFADKTIINFDDSVTGVVGPNGCGKSNIADAIRWVLGEQSVKSLRGEKMTDVIFVGSDGRNGSNMAEVTLVFDNTDRRLNSDLDEIELSRRIYNTEEDAEYLINHQNVRLRDIQDLILDTGLGKESLSIISQGNIQSFAEAKPYDRRSIFEDAAGVSKYKKRKIESINKLERTKENLDRTFDILNELERQVSPLKRQARKAEIYRQKKQRLEEIEVAVLVEEINNLNNQKNEIEKTLFNLDSDIAMRQTTIQVHDNTNIEDKSKLRKFDLDINSTQEKLVQVLNEIQMLEARKAEVDEKRKYNIEVGTSEQKAKELKALLDEAKIEFEDRSNRLNILNNELNLLNTNLEEVAIKLAESSLRKEESYSIYNRLENRISVLENVLKDPFSSNAQAGVKTIITNKSSFYGVMGVIGQELHPSSGYEYAINSALSNSVYHIVTKDEESARNAIEFLKKNQSGRVTFLPITVLKEYNVKYEDEIVCKNTKGYLGIASDFTECNSEFDLVKKSLLSNTLVCDNLENANYLAQLLKYSYKIVTLDGEIVHRGGSITGGKVKNETSILTAQAELDRSKESLVSFKAQYEIAEKEYNDLISEKDKLDSQLTEKRISIATIEPVLEVKRAKYEKAKADYEAIDPENIKTQETIQDELVTKLNASYLSKDELSASLKLKREERMKLSAEIDRRDQQLRLIRRQVEEANSSIRQITTDKAVIETKLENDLNRLASEYQMTFEYASQNNIYELSGNEREEVITLRKEIQDLGNVNMNAPEEFDEVNNRYEFLKKNYDDLIASRDKILAAIEEMDQIMKKQFKDTFDEINSKLNETFNQLFGPGSAKLVLEDENDILNTGIDIDIKPLGKQVKSIRMFSGGEKTLVAMCVLFTILKVKPSPLILFDEVEAALDQSNVERFAKYIKNFSNNSQFIVITHRPGTMGECDTLYGVTMQHRGVSQLLKVKLVDAIELADKEATNG